MNTIEAFFARVRGHVQGVGFRYSAYREAARLRITGWVRNTSGGDVEVWAEGTPERISKMLAWLHKGPQFSRVDSVDIETKTPNGYREFFIDD
jgi:acylphosphatase